MFNILTTKDTDPIDSFNGIWHNGDTGALWIWANKPVLVGFSKDGKLLGIDVFEADFTYTPQINKKVNSFTYEYGKIPILMIAEVSDQDYKGGYIDVSLGSTYGLIDKDDKFVIVGQQGNVGIGSDLTIKCEPSNGYIKIKLTIISYE